MSGTTSDKRSLETPKSGAVTELFPYELPFNAAKAIAWLLILLFAAIVTGATIIQVPETIRAPFVLTPEGGADPLRAPSAGTLEAVHARETEAVAEGAVLFAIRSQTVRDWRTELATLREDLRANEVRRELKTRERENERELLKAELEQRTKEIEFQNKYLAAHKDLIVRMREMRETGLASPVDLLSQELALAGAERDVALAQQALEATQLRRQQLDMDHEQAVAELDLSASKAKVRIAALERQLRDCEDDTVVVRAPYDGTVVSVMRQREGDVVAVGQELCQMARREAQPVARLALPETGVPRAAVGLPVKLYFDAYPYQRYGIAGGTLRWVSPAAVPTEAGDMFPALVALDTTEMRVQGEAQELRMGMRGQARITVGRRTPIEFVFQPLRQLRENMAGNTPDSPENQAGGRTSAR